MQRKWIAIGLAVTLSTPAFATWEWSSFEGEERRSVIGCSDTETDGSWLCLAARCDAPGEINIYIELTNLDVKDELDIVIGEQRFTVVGNADIGDAPYSSRLEGDSAAILQALKAGSQAVLDRPQYPFNSGYDTIPLRGSSSAISALEQQCRAPDAQAEQSTGWQYQAPTVLSPMHSALNNSDDGVYALTVSCDARAGGEVLLEMPTQNYWGIGAVDGVPAPAARFGFAVDDGQAVQLDFSKEKDLLVRSDLPSDHDLLVYLARGSQVEIRSETGHLSRVGLGNAQSAIAKALTECNNDELNPEAGNMAIDPIFSPVVAKSADDKPLTCFCCIDGARVCE